MMDASMRNMREYVTRLREVGSPEEVIKHLEELEYYIRATKAAVTEKTARVRAQDIDALEADVDAYEVDVDAYEKTHVEGAEEGTAPPTKRG